MNFSLYLFGTPDGYNQYPADANSQLFQQLYQHQKTESQLVVYRKNQLIYYIYTQKLSPENSNTFLGICLVFNSIYCRKNKELFELFDRAYSDIALNGQVLKMDKNGRIYFPVSKFVNKPLEIERIHSFFQNNLRNHLRKDFVTLPDSFQMGNGTKHVSVTDDTGDILIAIRQYDSVVIAKKEKSGSELDRIHTMLADVYEEKQQLNRQYKKLLKEKKQYKIVMFLFFLVVGCCLGLMGFNRSLQSKDSWIQILEGELNEKKDTISAQRATIAQLKITETKLNSENAKLNKTINQKNSVIKNKTTELEEKIEEVESLEVRNKSLSSENSSLKTEVNKQKNQNKKLTSEITDLKKITPQLYQVIADKAFCYNLLGEEFVKSNYYYSSGNNIQVYLLSKGYALTVSGYIKLEDLQKK